MTTETKRRFAHLTLIELLIGVALLAVAGFFLVRNMQQAKVRAQTQRVMEAISRGDAPTLLMLLKENPELNDMRNEYGWAPLHIAAAHGNNELAALLLDAKADINAKDRNGNTPLHTAIANDKIEIVKLLLAKGADVHIKTNDGITHLNGAMGNYPTAVPGRTTPNQQAIIELLRAHGAKE